MTYVSTNSSSFLPSTEFIIPDVLDIKCGICELLVFCGCGKKNNKHQRNKQKMSKNNLRMDEFLYVDAYRRADLIKVGGIWQQGQKVQFSPQRKQRKKAESGEKQ